MGSIKLIAIATIAVFFIIISVTNEKFRKIVAKIWNKKIFKIKISIGNILVIITILGTVVISTILLMKARRTLNFIVDRDMYKEEINENESNLEQQ